MFVTQEATVATTVETAIGSWVGAEITISASLRFYELLVVANGYNTYPNPTCLPVVWDCERHLGIGSSCPTCRVVWLVWCNVQVCEDLKQGFYQLDEENAMTVQSLTAGLH